MKAEKILPHDMSIPEARTILGLNNVQASHVSDILEVEGKDI